MPLKIIRNDITKMTDDAIVNAANTALRMGGGVCGAIFMAAGAEDLSAECAQVGSCEVGQAVITSAYGLPAKHIIHTVGPIWKGGNFGEAEQLHNCYINSLALAFENKCRSIAFPLISSGIYGYPKDQAMQIAIAAISEFLFIHEMMVYLVVYDNKSYVLSEKIFSAIEKYIDDNYVEERLLSDRRRGIEPYEMQQLEKTHHAYISDDFCETMSPTPKGQRSLVDVIDQLDETFTEMLLRLIDEKGMTDVETYKRANIDRKLFSKIHKNKNYSPSKATAIAFAIALKLNLDETSDLLSKAGYALSHSNKFDVIIAYFIEEANYNIFDINQALFYYEQDLLGA